MRIYVATAWGNKARAREVMAELEAQGHTITYDWTLDAEIDVWQALSDYEGVKTADALVFLADPGFRFMGSLVEMGMALGIGIPVYLVGTAIDVVQDPPSGCIFTLLPQLRRGLPQPEGVV